MPTKPKPFHVLKNEKKSHRTKAELDLRKQGESALESGEKLKERPEVKKNELAHKEFLRLQKILKKISKNDALYESIINRYAMIQAECFDFELKREMTYSRIEKLEERYDDQKDGEMTLSEYYKLTTTMQSQLLDFDKQVQAKRKMLLEIEKECAMTIAAALRMIPKKIDETKQVDPLLKALRGGL